jgi:hypothetical protein
VQDTDRFYPILFSNARVVGIEEIHPEGGGDNLEQIVGPVRDGALREADAPLSYSEAPQKKATADSMSQLSRCRYCK